MHTVDCRGIDTRVAVAKVASCANAGLMPCKLQTVGDHDAGNSHWRRSLPVQLRPALLHRV